jgi:putative MFS transporter
MTINNRSIEDVPLNSFHRLLTVRSAGGSFVDGYVLSIIGVSLIYMTNALGLSGFWQGMIAASALIGIFFGGFLGGWLTGRLGRKRVFFIGPALFVLSSVAQYWVESALALFVLRFVIGIAVGIEYPVATSLLVEFLPKKYRGPRLAMLTIMWFAGAAFAYVLGNFILNVGGEDGWRLVLFGAYALFIGGAQVLQLVYPNELFPTEIRAQAVGIGTSLSRVGAAVGTWLVPMSLESLGIANTMLAAAAVTFVGLAFAWALAPETRSLNLQQAASLS